MNVLCNCRCGRILLHVAAMIGDRQVKWHLAGVTRELPLMRTVRAAYASVLSARLMSLISRPAPTEMRQH